MGYQRGTRESRSYAILGAFLGLLEGECGLPLPLLHRRDLTGT